MNNDKKNTNADFEFDQEDDDKVKQLAKGHARKKSKAEPNDNKIRLIGLILVLTILLLGWLFYDHSFKQEKTNTNSVKQSKMVLSKSNIGNINANGVEKVYAGHNFIGSSNADLTGSNAFREDGHIYINTNYTSHGQLVEQAMTSWNKALGKQVFIQSVQTEKVVVVYDINYQRDSSGRGAWFGYEPISFGTTMNLQHIVSSDFGQGVMTSTGYNNAVLAIAPNIWGNKSLRLYSENEEMSIQHDLAMALAESMGMDIDNLASKMTDSNYKDLSTVQNISYLLPNNLIANQNHLTNIDIWFAEAALKNDKPSNFTNDDWTN